MTEVDLQKAYNDARQQYTKNMQLACRPEAPSLTQETFNNLQDQEVQKATATFKIKARQLLVHSNVIQNKLKTLTEELNKYDKEYFDLNAAKVTKTVAKGKTAFYKAIELITQGKPLCLNEHEVENVHREGIQAAEKAYDADRTTGYGPDWDRHILIDNLELKVIESRLVNTKNNKLFGFELAIKYFQEMLGKCTRERRLSEAEFNSEHEKARARALEAFMMKRNRPSQFKEDILKFKMDQYIMIQYSLLKQINASSGNKGTFKLAISAYDEAALAPSKLWQYCLHPEDLKKDHEDAVCRVLRAFRPNRTCSEGFHDSEKEELDLHLILENRYRALADINNVANKIAEEGGYLEFIFNYSTLINYYTNRWTGLKQSEKQKCYEKAIKLGLDAFYEKRRDKTEHAADTYKEELLSRTRNYAQVDRPDKVMLRSIF